MFQDDEPITLDTIGTKLRIEDKQSVLCKINVQDRQVAIERMELYLEGDDQIPAGWRAKIRAVSGIDNRQVLDDSIVLPTIVPGRITPIGPFFADIPNDLLNSQDVWEVEFCIVDSSGNERRLLRNKLTREEPRNADTQLAELKEFYETQITEKSDDLKKAYNELVSLRRENANLSALVADANAKIERITEEKDAEIKKQNDEYLESVREIREVRADLNKLRLEFTQLGNLYDRSLQVSEEQKTQIESLRGELESRTGQLTQYRDDGEVLERDRDRAIRLAEEQESKIARLETELEASQEINSQRNAALEAETAKSRELEKELGELRERLAEREAEVNGLNDVLRVTENQFTTMQTRYSALEERTQQASVEQERVAQLEKELEESRNKLADRNVELNNIMNEVLALRDKTGQAERERDNANRLSEEHKSRIQGLQAELDGVQKVLAQRSEKLESETVRSQRFERELSQVRELQAKNEKTVQQQEATISRLSSERDQAETEVSLLNVKNTGLEGEVSDQAAYIARLREGLDEAQSQLDRARSQVAELRAQSEKILAGQTIYERYELIKRGPPSETGEVYKVYDKKLGRAVALKILPPSVAYDQKALRQLTHEAQLLAKLTHINTIRLYDFVKTDEPYMVLEYVEGRTFRQIMDTEGRLPLDHVMDFVDQICKGLNYAHSQGIYHRSLRPEHLMLTDDGFIKIMEFGIADTISTTVARMTGKTSPDMMRYLSPEQLRGDPKMDGRADIYSLGIVCYELLSGQPPFAGEDVEEIVTRMPPPIGDVPPEINDILQKCLQKKADDRYANVSELHNALLAASATLGNG